MRHLFIVTYGRSGSTALQNALNAIEGVTIRGEAGGALNHLGKAVSVIEAGKHANKNATDPTHPWYGISDVDTAEFRRRMVEAFRATVLRPEPNTLTIGMKEVRFTPRHLDDKEFSDVLSLMREFEDCRIVFLTRDPVAVSQSGWWAKQDAQEVIPLIEDTIARFRAHQDDDTFLIDHSEFDRNPEGLLPLFEWLGEEPPEKLSQVAGKRLNHMKGWRERLFSS